MQPEERDLIADLFGRLKSFEAQPRDPDAERFIAGGIAAQPAAPYLLVQTVLVQEHALKAAQDRIAQLEAKVAAAPPPGFLASAPRIGPWGGASVPSTPAPQPVPVPPPMAPGMFQGAAQGGGFLRQALSTAAGVAGGALLFEGIRNMLGHNPGPFGALDNTVGSSSAALDPVDPLLPPDNYRPPEQAQDDNSPADDYDTASDDSSDSSDSGFGGGSDDV
jgi:uncharacterized protein